MVSRPGVRPGVLTGTRAFRPYGFPCEAAASWLHGALQSVSWLRAPEPAGLALNTLSSVFDVTRWTCGTERDARDERPRQHPRAAVEGQGPLGRLRCRRSPLYGHLECDFVTSKLKGDSQARRGGGSGAGQVVGGTDSQSEPELHLSTPHFSIPDAPLGESLLFTLGSGSQCVMRA